MKISIATLFSLSILFMGGCTFGPKAIKDNFTHYNNTLHYNQNQQLLINIVRMKYREPVTFMKVGTLSTGYSYGMSSSYSGSKSYPKNPTARILGWNFGTNYSEKPTITYNMIEGETFVKQMMKEIDTEAFVLLYRSGWPIDKLMYLLMENTGTNSIDDNVFDDIAIKLKRLQKENKLDLFIKEKDKVKTIVATWNDEDAIDKKIKKYEDLAFNMRSFNDVMFELSKCVNVPPMDNDVVKEQNTNSDFKVLCGLQNKRAFISVLYRGHRFYIPDQDLESKNYFTLLRTLYQLQSGDIKSVQPVFTISNN